MKQLLTVFFISSFLLAQAQEERSRNEFVFTPELLGGVLAEANENFPEHDPPLALFANFGWEHDHNTQEWARRLKGPRTGIMLGYTRLGADSLGASITVMPTIEFNVFRKEKLKVLVGMGASYFTEKFDPVTNFNNQGITTDITMSFRSFIHYQILSGEAMDWRLGLGYLHHSNGHTRLPNQGLNMFLLSLSADIKDQKFEARTPDATDFSRSCYSYAGIRTGYGINVLATAEPFNDIQPIYTVSLEYGRVLNNTFKLGVGLNYRYYQHYYDYIANNESLVQDGREFASLRDNPGWNASNIGIHGAAEILLNHFGIEVQIGLNLHKPAYPIDWRLNQGWKNLPRVIPADSNIVLGEFDTSYELKKLISSRMGLKYYLFGNHVPRSHNVFAGIHINSNLGQADFSEFSMGYVYNFGFGE
ncbi:MAG: acyloxyacyl hydrolase [Bacteroidota bacterium]